MIICFTGTRSGLTKGQIETLDRELNLLDDQIVEFHHGGAVGADSQFHNLLYTIFEDGVKIHVHPGPKSKTGEWPGNTTIHQTRPNLIRNQDLVNIAEQFIACPNSDRERIRSGTWSTIRKAKKKKMLITIIYPDGRILKTWGKQRKDEVKKNQYIKTYGG